MALGNLDDNHKRLLHGEILRYWEQLTASDLEEFGADESRLADLLQTRYGYAKRRAEKEVALFWRNFQDRLRMAA